MKKDRKLRPAASEELRGVTLAGSLEVQSRPWSAASMISALSLVAACEPSPAGAVVPGRWDRASKVRKNRSR